MTTETLTNLPGDQAGGPAANEPGAPQAAGVGVLDQGTSASQSDLELGPDGQPLNAEPDPETEEVDHEGKKYKIPKVLKPALLMHADYTRKTQEHAEKVRSDELRLAQAQQELAQHAQVENSLVAEHAALANLDSQLATYAQVNWQAAVAQDPAGAQAAWMTYQQLKEQRTGAANNLQGLRGQRLAQIQQRETQALEAEFKKLPEAIPGWSPELQGKLVQGLRETYGVSPAELATVKSVTAVRILHDAWQYQQMMKNAGAASPQRAPQGLAQPAGVKPSTPVPVATLPAGGSGNVRRIDDPGLSTSDWMKLRSQQLNKRRAK
jgi:hypothetical protein